MSITKVVARLPEESLTYTNCVYVNHQCYETLRRYSDMAYGCINTMIFCFKPHNSIRSNDVCINSCARQLIGVVVGDAVTITPVEDDGHASGTKFGNSNYAIPKAGTISIEVALFKPGVQVSSVNFEHLEIVTRETLLGHVVHLTQNIAILLQTIQLKLRIANIELGDNSEYKNILMKAKLTGDTILNFSVVSQDGTAYSIKKTNSEGIFKKNFKFEELGIGGLDNEFADIFRRAFASRIYPPELLKQLGISHVKGLILYGPPGTGKTLIARQISKALNCTKPKTVNGPEVMSRFFGQSEENIRNLFKDAEDEYVRLGDASSLHIIIFDEIDSICQRRGSDTSGTAARDSIVNQLLSKIDGIDSLNNILLIGMTNRLDMIDEALLRPGRFDVHIEVGLPDEYGRCQILKIHTRVMRESKRLSDCVNIKEISHETKNYSGAELEGLVKCAVSYAIQRHVDAEDITKPKDIDKIIVKHSDFIAALDEVKPAYGVDSTNLSCFMRHGIIPFGREFHSVLETCTTLASQVGKSAKTPVLSVLLYGQVGSGKSALAAHVATIANFPFVKVISPENLIGLSELAKVNAIHKVFDDAHKTPQSLIILDCIERIIDYSPIGPRFSNNILQCLLILIKKTPTHARRIFVIGTTSEGSFMEVANIKDAFTVSVEVPLVVGPSEISQVLNGAATDIGHVSFNKSEIDKVSNCKQLPAIGIKQLLLALEIAIQKAISQESDTITCKIFLESLQACGYDI